MLLSVNDLCVEFRDKVAVNHVNFQVEENEIVGIIGESGSGKSVSALSIMGLLNDDASVSGSTMFDGKDLSDFKVNERQMYKGKEISMVFQEPMTSLNPLMKIGRQVEEVLLLHPEAFGTLTEEERKAKVIENLTIVGLDHPEEIVSMYPHELSGGMRQRVMIAIALIGRPRLMIADEPTTALDVQLQDQILKLLKKLNQEMHMAVLFISHNMSIVRNFCDRIYVMQNGKIVETGTPEEIFKNPKEDYTKVLIASIPDGREREDKDDALEEPVLEIRDFSAFYPKKKKHFFEKGGRVCIVDHVNLTIHEGECVGLVGRSGCGKSTLSKGILGLLKDTEGAVIHHTKHPQMIFQDPYSSLNPKKKIGWILKQPLALRTDLTQDQKNKLVIETVQQVGLMPEVLDRYPRELSGGMRQRISIAIALVQGSKFIIADEPVSALDVTVQKQILELFLKVQRETGIAFLFISHDRDVVKQMCHRIVYMADGKLSDEERGKEILDKEAPV
ncbi:MAG: ABC transporter ATP-binding protein [Lachnospiraceae bacterium]|nr:ABC transporter ATP-binding protein [Lachnospiraceae bacterium]